MRGLYFPASMRGSYLFSSIPKSLRKNLNTLPPTLLFFLKPSIFKIKHKVTKGKSSLKVVVYSGKDFLGFGFSNSSSFDYIFSHFNSIFFGYFAFCYFFHFIFKPGSAFSNFI